MLDRRLLRAARPARAALTADVVAGLGIALLAIAQAWLLARIVAGTFAGAPAASLVGELVLLAAAFAARGALGWGVEVAGRHAASAVLSELRLALAARRLRAQPAALDGVEAGEITAVSVQGVEALGTYFARCLPQIVLACVVPLTVLAAVAAVDPLSAAIMAATLPLVPLFMWLVGRYTEQRSAERWQALRLLSVHFLDVVRGLPTLRAFNRAHGEADRLAAVGAEYRRATMGTLRVAFLSGAVLELAATLGVAIVAVAVGLRLVDGALGLEAGLFVLVLAPELYAPLRRLGADYHASADGLAVAARALDLLDGAPEAVAGGSLVPPGPARATVRLERVGFSYPARAGAVLDDVSLELAPGETVALVGPSGAGKSTIAGLLLLLFAPTEGRVTVGGVDLGSCRPELLAQHGRVGAAAPDARARDGRRKRPPRRPRRGPGPGPRGGAARGRRRVRRGAAGRLRDAHRRGRPPALGGRAPPPRARSRVPARRAARDPRRADRRPRPGERRASWRRRSSGSAPAARVLLIAHRPELAARADRVIRLPRRARPALPIAA